MAKTATAAPMPNVSVRTAAVVNAGRRHGPRNSEQPAARGDSEHPLVCGGAEQKKGNRHRTVSSRLHPGQRSLASFRAEGACRVPESVERERAREKDDERARGGIGGGENEQPHEHADDAAGNRTFQRRQFGAADAVEDLEPAAHRQ